MTLRARRIIYLTFILIFVIITPVIIFYATGYRYNFKKNKIQKTGILILKSKSKDAAIYLNDKPRKEKTPARIINLIPDDYFVKLEKENFHSWQKKLTIESNITTFAEDIILFKKNLPSEIKINPINLISLSPDGKKLAYTLNLEHSKEVWILTLEDKKEQLIYRTSNENEINFLEWSPTNKKILIAISNSKGLKKYLVFDIENGQEINIYDRLQDFYAQFKKIEEKQLPVNFIDYDLIESPNQFTTLIDKKNRSLLILDPKNNEIIFEAKARGAEWFSDGQKLLYFNDFELWVYDLRSNEEQLITRYSKEILNAEWYLNANYIILLTNNSIKTIELDPRDVRNIVELAKMDEIYNFEINKKEEKIYLLGKIGEKTGIYELELN